MTPEFLSSELGSAILKHLVPSAQRSGETYRFSRCMLRKPYYIDKSIAIYFTPTSRFIIWQHTKESLVSVLRPTLSKTEKNVHF